MPRQKSKVRVIATQQWEMHKNEVFHALVSKYFLSLYIMVFILMKAMSKCTLTPITTTRLHISVTKMAKTLHFDNFLFSRHDIGYDVTVTSYMVMLVFIINHQWLEEIHS